MLDPEGLDYGADSTWAKVGDTISIKFVANELLSDQITSIVRPGCKYFRIGWRTKIFGYV